MAASLINLSGFAYGIPSAELGMNCESFKYTVKPTYKEKLPGIDNQPRGFALGDPMGELSMKGELNTGTLAGLGLATFGTAFVPVNAASMFGRSQGGWYPDSLTVEKVRSGFTTIEGELSADWNIA